MTAMDAATGPVPGEDRLMRDEGYAPIAAYGAIGDGRSVALVAKDGGLDWMCLPGSTSPAAFAALLDPEHGGSANLAPTVPYAAERDYLEDTNVLQTTYRTATGTARLTEAMTLDSGRAPPWSEVVRHVECLAGDVAFDWSVAPRARYGAHSPVPTERHGIPVLGLGHVDIAVHAWNAGKASVGAHGVSGRMQLRGGETALVVLTATAGSPIAVPARGEVERRLLWTSEDWRRVVAACAYDGPWRAQVRRSALVLHLLIDAGKGMLLGAPTTSLPERVGTDRNYDYRFGWVRDSCFALDALMQLGYRSQAHASLSWLLNATNRTHPAFSRSTRSTAIHRLPSRRFRSRDTEVRSRSGSATRPRVSSSWGRSGTSSTPCCSTSTTATHSTALLPSESSRSPTSSARSGARRIRASGSCRWSVSTPSRSLAVGWASTAQSGLPAWALSTQRTCPVGGARTTQSGSSS
jgi:glycosyl hydrolase family 15/trehalase-like protein